MTSPLARLLAVAAEQHGLFTVDQAAAVDVSAVQVRKMALRGEVERRAHGLYRIRSMPIGPRFELMEATLWARGRGRIVGESSLALWGLADVNPRRVHLCVPPGYRPRRQDGHRYAVRSVAFAPADLDEVDNVPTLTPAAAIRDAITTGTPGDLIDQAIHQAQARELIGQETATSLRSFLRERTGTSPIGTTR